MNEELELKNSQALVLAEGRAVSIVDSESLRSANGFLVTVAAFIKRAKAYWTPLYEKAKANLDEVKRMRDEVIDPAEEAKAAVKKALSVYLLRQEELRLEAEAAAWKESQEKIRKNFEARDALELAGIAEEMGDKTGAEELLSQAAKAETEAAVAPQVFAPPAPVLEGIHKREHYNYEVLDEARLPREYLKVQVDAGKIRKAVDEKKMAANIPGVLRVYRDDIIVNR